MTDTTRSKGDLIEPGDLPAALGLLTRLPVPVDGARATARGSRAAWAWPLAGVVVAVLAGAAGTVAGALGLPPALAAVLVVAVPAVVTGAMHEDGLADSADGLWGGWDKARRLEIMKDSRTGAYGVLALVLALLARWAAVAALIEAGWLWAPLVAAAAVSRGAMAATMAALPNARGSGLSQGAGRPSRKTATLAAGVALAVSALAIGPATLATALAAGLVALGWGAVAKARIGGQTGDILGASQVLTEIAALWALAAALT